MLLDTAFDAVLLRKKDGSFTYVNEAAAKLYGYSREELLKLNMLDLLALERHASYQSDQTAGILKSKGEIDRETIHVRKDKPGCRSRFTPITSKSESGEYIMMVVRDITHRKHAEEELKLRATLLDSASDAIMLRRPDGAFIYVNEAAVKQYAYSREEFLRLNMHDLVLPGRLSIFEENEKVIWEKGGVNVEAFHRRKDGTVFPVEAHAAWLKRKAGTTS